jgi:uncharacterized protein (DUF849 family)
MTVNHEVIITCALTGAGDTVGRSEHVPVTPAQIAASAVEAANAGAAVVHIHVRDIESGQGSRDVALYREVVRRVRDSGVDVVINLTAGMGGDLVLDQEDPLKPVDGTDLVNGLDRLPHVEELLPDICTLDCGSLNFGEGNQLYVSTPDMLRAGAKRIQELGVKPEMEIFDTGHLWFATKMIDEGLIDPPPLFQLGVVRDRPRPAAVGGAVGAARRARAGGAGGQPLPQQGRQGHQRPARRTRGEHHRGPRRHGRHPGPGPPQAGFDGGRACLNPLT